MLNIIQSDIYRLRKGVALRNTLIALFLLLLFVAGTYRFMTSEGMTIMLDEAAQQMSAEMGDMSVEMDDLQEMVPANAAEFADVMLGDNMIVFFALPLVISIFCADFTAGTYRNTLSYAPSRTEVYLAKLILSVLCSLLLIAAHLVFCWLIGGVLFGFGGFSGAYFAELFTVILLLLPTQLAIIGFCHFLIALTRRSSATIGIYIGVLLGLSMVVQIVSMVPSLRWISLLDWNSVGAYLVNYPSMSATQLAIVFIFYPAVLIATTVGGILRYNSTDMA